MALKTGLYALNTGLQAPIIRFCDAEKTDGYLKMPPVRPRLAPTPSALP